VRRSIGFPLTLGIILTLLVLSLAVGWQILVVSDVRRVASGLTRFDWALLVFGTVFFALVIVGLVWLCAWLVREMRVNQRQRAFLDAVTHEMKTPLASLRPTGSGATSSWTAWAKISSDSTRRSTRC
jgi:signal transduction histidine kinase